jgi:hypothetical protein
MIHSSPITIGLQQRFGRCCFKSNVRNLYGCAKRPVAKKWRATMPLPGPLMTAPERTAAFPQRTAGRLKWVYLAKLGFLTVPMMGFEPIQSYRSNGF